MIPYGHQTIDDDDIAAVVAVLKGDWLTQGPCVPEFEHAICARTGALHCVTFSSGTAALHAAAFAAELGPEDLVGTSTLSFVASANCARYVGATPVLLDIDEHTLNFRPDALPTGLEGLVAVHYAGLPVDLSRLNYRPRVVIEDAAHALGASTPDGPVGACAHSDMCCFSFHPVKAITTGEGGAVTTNSADLAHRLRQFRSHGIDRVTGDPAWRYQVVELGYNYRLTDIQAALGKSQLTRLERFVARRQELANAYRIALSDSPLVLPPSPPAGFSHAWHIFPVQVDDRDRVFEDLRAAGIGVQVHYIPIHQHPAFASWSVPLPTAERITQGILSLPLFPSLTDCEFDAVVAAVEAAL